MDKLIKVAGIVILVAALAGVILLFASRSQTFGAVGVKLIEQYDPYVRYNGGINSALPIQTTSTITGNGLTVSTSNAATSTTNVGCIQTYATSTATPLHLEFSTTTTLAAYNTQLVGNAVAWRYGACPI